MSTSLAIKKQAAAALVVGAAALFLASAAVAQDPDLTDQSNDAESAPADDDAAEDEVDQVDESDSVPMGDDEQWADDVIDDPSDDAIPEDSALDPPGEEWVVTEFQSDGDNQADVPVEFDGSHFRSADIPVIRRVKRQSRPAANEENVPYSTGGEAIRVNGAPWQAQIYYPHSAEQFKDKLAKGVPLWQLQHYCGGALIADEWVLTAAHCIDNDMVRAGYRVRLGATDISQPTGWNYKIDRIVRHADYAAEDLPKSPNMYANDIALVHIVEDIQQPPRDPQRVRAIPVYERPLPAGAEVTGTGWGKTQDVAGHVPNAILMKVDLRVMDSDRCRKLPSYGPQIVHAKMFCAANPKRSTCQGDSGGAMVLTNGAPTVVGIVSWGKKRCNGDGQPAGYTRIESYLGWIKQAMRLDPTRGTLR